jgi:hypothetical protein
MGRKRKARLKMVYKLTRNGSVVRRIDDTTGAVTDIPVDESNQDYQDYLAWVAAGNTPIPSATLAERQDAVWAMIKARRDFLSDNGGYKVAVAGVDKWFHSDARSKTQQIGLVLAGAGIPLGLQWKTMDGTFVTMTQALAGQIFQSAMAQDSAIFQAAETHRAAMLAAPDPDAYDFSSTGWPATFAG